MVKKEVTRQYCCLICGAPFDAVPPDDRHTIAVRDENKYKDHIKVPYKCKECGNFNTIYWGHDDSPPFVIGHF